VFPGANGPIIPQSAWSPVAVATLQFLPDPNGSEGGTPTFSTTAEKLNLRDDKFGIKVDFNTAHLGNWSGYLSFRRRELSAPLPGVHFESAWILRRYTFASAADSGEQHRHVESEYRQRAAPQLHALRVPKEQTCGRTGQDRRLWIFPR